MFPAGTPTPPCEKDDRIELIQMGDDPCPIPTGTKGTVTALGYFQGAFNIDVKWDNGRTLSLVCPPDTFRIIPTEDKKNG